MKNKLPLFAAMSQMMSNIPRTTPLGPDRGKYRGPKHESGTASNRRRAKCYDVGHKWEPIWSMPKWNLEPELRHRPENNRAVFRCRRCGYSHGHTIRTKDKNGDRINVRRNDRS